jgi:hypothetical protein
MFCSHCNRKVPEDSLFCPYCDAPQSREAAKARTRAWVKAGESKRYLYGVMIAEFALIIILTITLANRPLNAAATRASTPTSTPVVAQNSAATFTPFVAVGTPVPGPASVKELVAEQKHADDFVVYMVLADQQGNIVQGEGGASVDVYDQNGSHIFRSIREVKPENFVPITGDSGDSELSYSFGLFKYADLGKVSSGATYTIHLIFTPKVGNPLTKDTTITLQ